MGPVLWSSDLDDLREEESDRSRLAPRHAAQHPALHGHRARAGQRLLGVQRSRQLDRRVRLRAPITASAWTTTATAASLEYAAGSIKYAPGIPSHLVYRAADAMLYVADTGNGRIVKLDTESGVRGVEAPDEGAPDRRPHRMNDAVLTDVVAARRAHGAVGPRAPRRPALRHDNATGRILAFDLEGKQLNSLDTGLGAGALAGLAFGPDGKLYFVDMVGEPRAPHRPHAQLIPRDRGVVERADDPGDRLRLLVPLAGDDDNVVALGLVDRAANGPLAIGLFADVARW